MLEKLGGIEPAERISHIRHVVELAPAWDDPGGKIQDFLDRGEIFGGAVAVYCKAVAGVWNDEGGDDVRNGLGREVMTKVGKGD